jgi:hypothetical protein
MLLEEEFLESSPAPARTVRHLESRLEAVSMLI